ncbi:hypothetical protein [Bradyrhizobium sp. STM 3557]|uniref:hypothetical protein n=1 Tax=Bradyrhizobium sp. STM 3557 TaxID=578920 RepID=UPI00388D7779
MSGQRDHSPAVRPGEDVVSAVELSQQLTAVVDAWAEAHRITRADAIRRLLELALAASPPIPAETPSGDPLAIEREAIRQIEEMLDPALPAGERERRIRRLTEGPPEFSKQRVDLPKHRT